MARCANTAPAALQTRTIDRVRLRSRCGGIMPRILRLFIVGAAGQCLSRLGDALAAIPAGVRPAEPPAGTASVRILAGDLATQAIPPATAMRQHHGELAASRAALQNDVFHAIRA